MANWRGVVDLADCANIQQVSDIDHDSGNILILFLKLTICKVDFVLGLIGGY